MQNENENILDRLGVSRGLKVEHAKTITEADINNFAKVSGDFNPIHMEESYARKTFFHGRIGHGALAVALLSAAMAKLPGLVIFVSHSVKFVKPIRIGDRIRAIAEVIGRREDKGIVTLKNICINQNDETVVEGDAIVRLYEEPM